MPWNKDGSRKSSPLYKKSGFKMKGSPFQRNFGIKSSPMKIWPAILKAVVGMAAGDTAGKNKPEVYGKQKKIME